ncbi:MAG: SusC/RagA family TonB-linked outer membrane protein [Sphingobacteriia bacterium]|nr:MAG: SusC/RagA family TonB-linked outer membrane protein [Sphingobacteriia bacterium]
MRKKLLFSFCAFVFACFTLTAQNITVTGKVTEGVNKNPLPGASISLNGKVLGLSKPDGMFTVSVPAGTKKLAISYIGMDDQLINVGAGLQNVQMSSGDKSLNEVIVTGYSARQKRSNIGSATVISADEVGSQPLASFDQMLQGQVAGLNVKSGSGQPGRSADVVIRGKGSINGSNAPLYVVDGVEVRPNDFSTMNPADFDSYTILKDAASTSIYGSRGANGVIVVTTKRGKQGRVRFIYDGQFGSSQLPKNQLELMNTKEKLDFEVDIAGNPWGWTPAEVADFRKVQVNWDDFVFQKGSTASHQFSASGGNEKTTFYTSFGAFDQRGVVIETGLKRYTGRVNITHTENNIKLGVNISGGWSDYRGTSEGNQSIGSPLNTVIWALPYEAPYDAAGKYTNSVQFPYWLNPIEELKENADNIWGLKGTGNAFLEYKFPFVKNLSYRLNVGGDYSQDETSNITNRGTQNALQSGALGNPVAAEGTVSRFFDKRFRYTITQSLSYKTVLDKKGEHSLSVSAYYEFVKRRGRRFGVNGFGLLLPFRNEAGLVAGTASNGFIPTIVSDPGNSGNYFPDNSSIVSYFGTADYAFKNKYFLSVTARTDGSSRLSPQNRWTSYGSIAAGWIISDEAFFQKNDNAVNFLKFKASYGTVGNQNGIGDFPYLQQYGRGTYGGNGTLQVNRLANNELTWEKRRTINLGVEFEMFRSKVRGTIEWYNGLTSGLYLSPYVPATSGGAGNVLVNKGSMVNKGIEVSLGFKLIDNRDFKWNIDLNYAHNRNEIKSLPDNQNLQLYGTGLALQTGKPFNSFYLVKYAGVNPANGNSQYLKADGKTITEVYDANDLVVLGTSDAPHNGGLTNTFRYKSLELSAFFVVSAGNYVYNNARYNVEFYQYTTSGFARSGLTAWTTPGQVTNFPRIDEATESNTTRFLEKGDFWRLRNIMISYDLPASITSKLKIQGLRFYAQGQNLFSKFQFQGWDAETSTVSGGNAGESIGGAQYPPLKTINLGLRLIF